MFNQLIALSGLIMFVDLFIPGMVLWFAYQNVRDGESVWREELKKFRVFVILIFFINICIVYIAYARSISPKPVCSDGYTLAGGGLLGGILHCVPGRPVEYSPQKE